MVEGLVDPLGAVRAISALDRELAEHGFSVSLSTDFAAFTAVRSKLRGGAPVAPLFDPAASALPSDKGFWMKLTGPEGSTRGLQAFRADFAEPSLADWALGWMIGIYLKRSELIIPAAVAQVDNSVAKRISGVVVYHGELWIEPTFRNRSLMEPFSRMGVLLSYLRWRPAAVWALSCEAMALKGQMTRMGYGYIERGFMRWRFLPENADASEWLSIADRTSLEQLIGEMVLTRSGCPQG
jgi:hypothetical protein